MASSPQLKTIPFSGVSGRYFVKNYVPLKARTFFLIRDFATFESIFGYGAVMGSPSPAVTRADFAKHEFVVAVRRGPLCKLMPTLVTTEGANVFVNYTSKCEAPGSATYAVPMILSLPMTGIGTVRFVENGTTVGTLQAASRAIAAPHG